MDAQKHNESLHQELKLRGQGVYRRLSELRNQRKLGLNEPLTHGDIKLDFQHFGRGQTLVVITLGTDSVVLHNFGHVATASAPYDGIPSTQNEIYRDALDSIENKVLKPLEAAFRVESEAGVDDERAKFGAQLGAFGRR